MLRLRTLRRVGRSAKPSFLGETSGVAAIEFALIVPVLTLLLGAAVELSGAITAGNRATYVAEAIAQVISQAKEPINASNMNAFIQSAALVNPDILRYAAQSGTAVRDAALVNITSVQFAPRNVGCIESCGYKANVVFSKALAGPERACGELVPNSSRAVNTLPPDVFGPGSLVVVDVEIFYQPLMKTLFGDAIGFRRSSYFRPRYIARVNSDANCPGYAEN